MTEKKDDRSAAAIRKLLDEAKTPLEKLRVPFPEHQIGLLPKAVNKEDKQKSACKPGTNASVDGKFCGGYHTRSVHLDFVGHAALTDRLLEVDPVWSWRPLATDDYGLPKLDQFGGLWIELTVAGVTRLGYGDAQGKAPSSIAIKEIIGDALRNAGMRFGMALDLWHKGDLHDWAEEQGKFQAEETGSVTAAPSRRRAPAPKEPAEPPTEESAPSGLEDWITKASDETTSDGVRAVWQEARNSFPRVMTKEQRDVLDRIQRFGEALAAQEAGTNPAAAQSKASEDLAAGFSGRGEPS